MKITFQKCREQLFRYPLFSLLLALIVLSSTRVLGQTNCNNPYTNGAVGEMITHVKFNTIDNATTTTLSILSDFEDFTHIEYPVTKGQSYTLYVKGPSGEAGSNVVALFDWNSDGLFTPDEYYVIGVLPEASIPDADFISRVIQVPYTAIHGPILLRIVKAYNTELLIDPEANAVTLDCYTEYEAGQIEDYAIDIQEPNPPINFQLDSLTLTTAYSQPAIIPSLGDSLILVSVVHPLDRIQDVSWEIQNLTGTASIEEIDGELVPGVQLGNTAVVVGLSPGQVRAVATSLVNPNFSATIDIQINQIFLPESCVITLLDNHVPIINGTDDTAYFAATIYPLEADQAVTWELYNFSGEGVLTENIGLGAILGGQVAVIARSVVDPSVADSMIMTLIPQGVSVEKINKQSLAVYPNPVQTSMQIDIDGVAEIELLDLLGRSHGFYPVDERTVDLSAVPNGSYYLRTSIDEQWYYVRILKEN